MMVSPHSMATSSCLSESLGVSSAGSSSLNNRATLPYPPATVVGFSALGAGTTAGFAATGAGAGAFGVGAVALAAGAAFGAGAAAWGGGAAGFGAATGF